MLYAKFVLKKINGLSLYLQNPKLDISKAFNLKKSTYAYFEKAILDPNFFDEIYK